MAWVRVELLLVVLTGTLLLVSAQRWETIDGSQFVNFYERGQLGHVPTSPGKGLTSPDKGLPNYGQIAQTMRKLYVVFTVSGFSHFFININLCYSSKKTASQDKEVFSYITFEDESEAV